MNKSIATNAVEGNISLQKMRISGVFSSLNQGSVLDCPKPVLGRTVPKTRFKPACYCPKLSKTAQNCLKLPTEYQCAKLILGQISYLGSFGQIGGQKLVLVSLGQIGAPKEVLDKWVAKNTFWTVLDKFILRNRFWAVLSKYIGAQNLFWAGQFKPAQKYGLNRPCLKLANPGLNQYKQNYEPQDRHNWVSNARLLDQKLT